MIYMTAFLGLTPSGSLFPFPNITGSISDQINTLLQLGMNM